MKNTSQVVDSLIQLNLKANDPTQSIQGETDNIGTGIAETEARRAYNLNPLALDQTSQLFEEDKLRLEMNAVENLQIESTALGELDDLSDYNTSQLNQLKQ